MKNNSAQKGFSQTSTLLVGLLVSFGLLLLFIWATGITPSILIGIGLGLGEILFFAIVIRSLVSSRRSTSATKKALSSGETGPVLHEITMIVGLFIVAPFVIGLFFPEIDWRMLLIISGLAWFFFGSLLALLKTILKT